MAPARRVGSGETGGWRRSRAARVQASMTKLNYRPLASARGMRGQTFTLGIALPDMRNPFFADIWPV